MMIEELKDENTQHWRISILFIVGIFVLVGIVLLVKGSIWEKNDIDNFQGPPDNLVTPNVIRTNSKEAIEEFPEELILNSEIEIIGSYSATYLNSPAKQITVEFISSKNQKEILDFYTKWAENNDWQIINSSKGNLISSLYLKKASERINITINSKGTVTISYVKLNK